MSDSKTHSTVILNGDVATAELSGSSASESQETHPSGTAETLAEPPRSPELEEATEELSLGKRLRVGMRN